MKGLKLAVMALLMTSLTQAGILDRIDRYTAKAQGAVDTAAGKLSQSVEKGRSAIDRTVDKSKAVVDQGVGMGRGVVDQSKMLYQQSKDSAGQIRDSFGRMPTAVSVSF